MKSNKNHAFNKIKEQFYSQLSQDRINNAESQGSIKNTSQNSNDLPQKMSRPMQSVTPSTAA